MLQAWMILPALGIGYLLAAPGGLGRRLWHLGAAGLVMLAVSLSWIALYTFTPASDRPYVDGSTDNSAVAMVFGYNGVERFGIPVPGSVASFGGARTARVAGPAEAAGTQYNAGGFLGSSGGWAKLAGSRFGPEVGWLYPLDGAGAGAGTGLGGGRTGSAAAQIAAWVESSCAAVPGQDYGATSSAGLGGTGTLYECGAGSGPHG